MNFMPNDREPVYLQIIRYIKQQVVRGELNPGNTFKKRNGTNLKGKSKYSSKII